jgi:hypothetical protein
LPAPLAARAEATLAGSGIRAIVHDGSSMAAAEAAAADEGAVALIGPYRSHDVAEAVEATAPAGLALLAPAATWVGVTRNDEPGGDDDPADHRGTVLRLVARDMVVAERIAAHVREGTGRALVVAGTWEYGAQLDAQLRLAGLPRADAASDADLVVLAGIADEPGMDAAADSSLPVIAFDGAQGLDLGGHRDVHVALPYAPAEGSAHDDVLAGSEQASRAAELVATALNGGAVGRADVLAALRALGPFDAYGDPVDPPVWLWRADAQWALSPDRALT